MNIVHVLRDGSIVKDISGHIVRYEDAQQMYKAIKIGSKGKGSKED